MSSSEFALFSTRVEALHDTVCGEVGGDMLVHITAPFDPLFWSILANTDRILYRWQLRHRLAEPPRSVQLEDLAGPFDMTMILEKTTVKMGMEALTVCAYDTSVFQMEMCAQTDEMNLKAARLTTYFR